MPTHTCAITSVVSSEAIDHLSVRLSVTPLSNTQGLARCRDRRGEERRGTACVAGESTVWYGKKEGRKGETNIVSAQHTNDFPAAVQLHKEPLIEVLWILRKESAQCEI